MLPRPRSAPRKALAGSSVTPLKVFAPQFVLRDEEGNVINPLANQNARKPYSPKMTCGPCHDYDKVTQGFHFTQGQGESPTREQKERCLWASTPGNFGGNWCSPAPLYRYLSPKKNSSAATLDMTAFSFFTSPCGGAIRAAARPNTTVTETLRPLDE